jgi:hypothetical protein
VVLHHRPDLTHRSGLHVRYEKDHVGIAHADAAGRVQDGGVDGPDLKLDPRVSISSDRGMSRQPSRGGPMSTVTSPAPARAADSGPPKVSRVTEFRPVASISSQATQRAALPHCSTSPPSAFQMRINASASPEGSTAISWSKPIPELRSDQRRIWSAVGRNRVSPACTTAKSLPRPFILRKGRDMAAI